MILTGKKLEDLGLEIWGPAWKTILGRRLGLSRQTLHAKSRSKSGMTKPFKRALLAVIEEQLMTVAKSVDDLRDDVGP